LALLCVCLTLQSCSDPLGSRRDTSTPLGRMGFQSFVDKAGHYRMEIPEGRTHEDDLGDSFSTPNLDGVV